MMLERKYRDFYSKNRQTSYPKLNHGICGFFSFLYFTTIILPIFEKINKIKYKV